MTLRTRDIAQHLHALLALLLSAQLLVPSSAWAIAADGSTLAGDRGVQPDNGALAASLPADLFSGASRYRLPIELLVGTGGMTPELALTYSSAGPLDSWVGSRWSLGLPKIARSLKRGIPSYVDGVFTLDGQEVQPKGSITTLPRDYYTRRDFFTRITREVDGSWTVRRKNGVVIRFGLTPNARVDRIGGQTFEWLFSEQEDPHGNVISASYDRSDEGWAHLAEIRYTLRRDGSMLTSLDGDPARDRVASFALEARPDAPVNFAAGLSRRLSKRLDRIDVRVGSTLVRRYDLSYDESPDSFRSLLAQVAVYGNDADSANPAPPRVTLFGYHSNVAAETTGWEEADWNWASGLQLVSGGQKDNGVRLGDVDGDGLMDLIKSFGQVDIVNEEVDLSSDSGVYLNTGSGFSDSASTSWLLPTYANPGANFLYAPFFAANVNGSIWGTGRLAIDFTGDGRVDIVGGQLVLNPVTGNFKDSTGSYPERVFHLPWFLNSRWGWQAHPPSAEAPILGDGVLATAYMGQGLSGDLITIGGNTRFAELTGDGLPEIVVRGETNSIRSSTLGLVCDHAAASSYVIENVGGGLFEVPPRIQLPFSVPATESLAPALGSGGCNGTLVYEPAKFQVCSAPGPQGASCWHDTVFFSQAHAISGTPVGPPGFFWETHRELGNTLVDLNGDGLADHVTAYERGVEIRRTFLNSGTRNFMAEEVAWRLPAAPAFSDSAKLYTIESDETFSTDEGVRFADVNGDGRIDIVKAKGSDEVTWLNDGDVNQSGDPTPWVASSAWESPLAFVTSSGKDRGVRLVDVDGDGMVDIVNGDNRSIRLNRGEIPDLLTSVTEPLGAVTTFGYTPSTSFDNTGVDDVPDLPQVFPVVTSIALDDANGTTNTTTLDYEGGAFDYTTRDLLGFRRVTVTRAADGRTATTMYHQDFLRLGLVESVEVRNAQGAIFARTEFDYGSSFPALVEGVRRLEYDGQLVPRRSLTTFEYDDGGALNVGNVTAMTEYGEVTDANADVDPLDTRTAAFEYALPANPGQAVPYIVDRISVRRVRAGAASGSGAVLREARFFYDGDLVGGAPPTKGNLTHRVDVLDEPGLPNPTTRYDYDTTYGNLIRVTSPRATAGEFAGFAEIEYDALYHTFPVAMVNELGHRAELTYSTILACSIAHTPAAGLVHRVRDPNALAAGKSTLSCYDAFGRLVSERAPDGLAESTFVYVDTPGAATITRSDLATATSGVRTSTVYLDGLGRAVKTSSQGPQALLVEATARFDAAGRLASETAPRFTTSSDPLQTTQYAYDVLDRRTQATLPGVNRIHRLAFDRGLITATDANSNVTHTDLDAFGRVTAVEETGLPGSPVTYYEYDALGQLERVIDSGQNETVVEYDKLGRKTRLLDPDTGESLYGYDGNGNLTFESNALGAVAWFYDALDRPSERRPSAGQRAAWSYDRATNGIGLLAEESRSPIKYLPLAYDLLGRPTRERFVSTLDGPSHEIQTSYDPLDQVTSRAYPNGITALWQRDTRGFLTGIGTGTGETYADQIEWSPLGQLAKWRTGALATTTRRFESATGRLREIEVKPASGASYEYLRYGYDFGDRITSVTDLVNPARNRSFGFDVRNRLTSATGPYGTNAALQALHYQYDTLGNLLCRDGFSPTSCLGGAAFFYPSPGPGVVRPHAPTSASLGALGYDDAGNLTALGSRGYEYDVFGQLVRVRDGGALQSELFYDATGRLARVIDSVTGQVRYRLAPDFEWNASTNRAQIRIALAGNEIAVHDTAYDPNAPFGCSGTPGGVVGPADPAGLVVLFTPGLVALLGFALLQARRRRLETRLALARAGISVTSPPRWQAGLVATTGVVFVAVVSIPVPLFGPGNGTASAVSPASVTYYHGDHLGSSVVMTSDAAGSPLVRHIIYRPYGGVVVESAGGSSVPPEIGFTGQRFEKPAALYDYGARWYDPQLARFLQPDSLVPEPFNPQSLNRYSYVMNDPVNRIDPTGMSSILTGGGYYGESYGDFQQPPWERAAGIDLGLSRSSPEYLGLRQQPDSVPFLSAPTSPALGQSGPNAESSREPAGLVFNPDVNGLTSGGYLSALPGFTQDEANEISRIRNNAALVGSAAGLAGLGGALVISGPALVTLGVGLPPAVQSAVPKLTNLATKFQTTPPALLRNVLENGARFADLANKSNINVLLQRPDAAGFIRVTLDPSGQRVISAGLSRAQGVANSIARGRFVQLE